MRLGNVLPSICNTTLKFAEVDLAINRTKAKKAAGTDETQNEHFKMLDVMGRASIHRLFNALFDHNGDIDTQDM